MSSLHRPWICGLLLHIAIIPIWSTTHLAGADDEPLSGTIVDKSGKPIEGVKLQLSLWDASAKVDRPALVPNEFSIETDANGRWEWMPDDRVIQLRTNKFGYLPKTINIGAVDKQIVLADAYIARGNITDESGKPVQGATVSVALDADYCTPPKNTTQSDEHGRFELKGITRPNVKLRVVASNGSTGILDKVRLDAEHESNAVIVERPVPLRWKITERGGKPIDGTKVLLASWERSGAVSWEATADEQGRVEWKNAPSGNKIVVFQKEGFQSHWIDIKRFDESSSDYAETVLRPIEKISFRVVDAETRMPVKHCIVSPFLDVDVPATLPGESLMKHEPTVMTNGVLEVEDGHFEMTFHRDLKSLSFAISSTGYKVLDRTNLDVDDLPKEYTFELEPALPEETMVFQILGSDGKKVRGASALIIHNGSSRLAFDDDKLLAKSIAQRSSTSNGMAEVNDKGELRIAVSAIGKSVAVWNDSGWYFEKVGKLESPIQLNPYVQGEFVLSKSDKPIRNVVVVKEIDPTNGIWFPLEQDPKDRSIFRSNHIPIGESRLVELGGTFETLAKLSVEEGQNIKMNFRGTGELRGTLVLAENAPFHVAEIRILAMRVQDDGTIAVAAESQADRDGKFELRQLPEGIYRLRGASIRREKTQPGDPRLPMDFYVPIIQCEIQVDDDEKRDAGELNVTWEKH